MSRYVRLFGLQLRQSLQLAMQYRLDFFLEGLLSLLAVGTALVPLWVAFGTRGSIAGWTFEESLLVVAWFTLLRGVLEGAVNPSLLAVVEQIRLGTLDFVLLKPVDAQFLVSTGRFAPWHVLDALAALGLFAWSFSRMGRAPEAADVLVALGLLVAAVLILYSIWILVISAAFHVVRVDNLAYLFVSIFDAARWPQSVFRGFVRVIFTFILPFAVMTTYPALALLGRLEAGPALGALAGALTFAGFARWVWMRSLRRYTSASS